MFVFPRMLKAGFSLNYLVEKLFMGPGFTEEVTGVFSEYLTSNLLFGAEMLVTLGEVQQTWLRLRKEAGTAAEYQQQ